MVRTRRASASRARRAETMAPLVFAFTAWIASVALVILLFLEWTGSLLLSVPAAVCVVTGTGLLLARPPRR